MAEPSFQLRDEVEHLVSLFQPLCQALDMSRILDTARGSHRRVAQSTTRLGRAATGLGRGYLRGLGWSGQPFRSRESSPVGG